MASMKIYILSYFATAIVFLICDTIWLTATAGILYRPLLGGLLLEKFSLIPAAIFYAVYVAGIVIFAISPAVAASRWTIALGYGALFGFLAYATYDLTNQATLKSWSTTVTIFDLAWGTVLTSVSATLGYIIASAITKATSS
jgi:uncharacterized membrane protein